MLLQHGQHIWHGLSVPPPGFHADKYSKALYSSETRIATQQSHRLPVHLLHVLQVLKNLHEHGPAPRASTPQRISMHHSIRRQPQSCTMLSRGAREADAPLRSIRGPACLNEVPQYKGRGLMELWPLLRVAASSAGARQHCLLQRQIRLE